MMDFEEDTGPKIWNAANASDLLSIQSVPMDEADLIVAESLVGDDDAT